MTIRSARASLRWEEHRLTRSVKSSVTLHSSDPDITTYRGRMARKRKKRTPKRTPKKDWRPAFLEALAQTGSVVLACQETKVVRSVAYKHRGDEPEFAGAWTGGEQVGGGLIEGGGGWVVGGGGGRGV